MPTATNGDVSLSYERAGRGDPVVLLGDVGYGAWQWGWQYRALAGPFDCLVVETRGTGRSDAPPGPYSVSELADDVAAVLADAGVRSAHLVGAGLGGMVALETAARSGRARSLALVGTAAAGETLSLDPLFGAPDDPDALERSLRAALSASFVADHPDVVAGVLEWRADEDADREAWTAQAAAVEAFDAADRLLEVTEPTLVFHGTDDAVWPPEGGRALAERLPRGQFHALSGAGHLAGVERSRVVNDRLLGFLESDAA
jgi:pimeloyl-ACP methyl ester carboxylesterase